MLALLTVLVAGLLRSHGAILRRLHDLGVDLDPDSDGAGGGDAWRRDLDFDDKAPAPRRRPVGPPPRGTGRPAADLSGVTPAGEAVVVGVRETGRPSMLVFLSSGCSTCRPLWEALAREEAKSLPGSPRVVVITRDPSAESPGAVAALAPPGVTVVMSSRAFEDYEVPGAPYFVLVDSATSSVAGEGTARSWTQLAELVSHSLADADMRGRNAAGSKRGADAGMHGTGSRKGGGLNQIASAPGPERAARIDAELARAGIFPGDPSLMSPKIGTLPPTPHPEPTEA